MQAADALGGLRFTTPRGPDGNRFTLELHELVFGQPKEAALGMVQYLCVDRQELAGLQSEGVEALRREVEKYGTQVDKECFEYVMEQEAGKSDRKFQDGFLRDCLPDGTLHPDRRINGRGMCINDFLAHPNAREAKLSIEEVMS